MISRQPSAIWRCGTMGSRRGRRGRETLETPQLAQPNWKSQLTAWPRCMEDVGSWRETAMSIAELRDAVASSDIDPFSREFLADPYPFHQELRELGPAVRLTRYDIWAVTRYEQVSTILNNWETFGSGGGVGL